jgi:alpha-tubulin suppressor-like RCC1 family protein
MTTALNSRVLKLWALAAVTAVTVVTLVACGGGGGGDAAAGAPTPAPAPAPSPSPSPTPSFSLRPNTMAAGSTHSCAILRDANQIVLGGPIACWGKNGTQGALGNNSTVDSQTPVTVTGITTAIAVAVNDGNSCALLANGRVMCWGDNSQNQLGQIAFQSPFSRVPVLVDIIDNVISISLGVSFACAMREPESDGLPNIYCWGKSTVGQTGIISSSGSTTNEPTRVIPAMSASQLSSLVGQVGVNITSGDEFSCVLFTVLARKLCWGGNRFGQNGAQPTEVSLPNFQVNTNNAPLLSIGSTYLSAGAEHLCQLKSNGQVFCGGLNTAGQLGNGTGADTFEDPSALGETFPVVGLSDAVAVSGGNDFTTCALRATGAVVCWGQGSSGELGNGLFNGFFTPVQVQGLQDAVAISVGATHACALRNTGAIVCWGETGLLGSNTTTNSAVPIEVTGGAIFGR